LLVMIEVRAYVDDKGNCPFQGWFRRLDLAAKRKVETALARMEQGNLGDVRSVGKGLSEHRSHFGPGYSHYFGRDGETLIILLAGGTKKRQRRDIETAEALWQDYKRRG
jgi:putative addiction module killer protein